MERSAHLTSVSWRQTPDRQRCEKMGFTLVHSEVSWDDDALVLHGKMRCVCGKFEHFRFRIELDESALDPARLLRESGAFHVEHLKADGYTQDQIDVILANS